MNKELVSFLHKFKVEKACFYDSRVPMSFTLPKSLLRAVRGFSYHVVSRTYSIYYPSRVVTDILIWVFSNPQRLLEFVEENYEIERNARGEIYFVSAYPTRFVRRKGRRGRR